MPSLFLPLILRFPEVLTLGLSLQLYSPASAIFRSLMRRILLLPSTMCSKRPPSGSSSSPRYQVTSASGLETSQMSFTLSVSVPSTLDRFLVNLASSSAQQEKTTVKHLYQTSNNDSGVRLQFLPMTVSMPEDLEVLASHSYSASSSNTDLWTMRMCWRPWAIISYFFPFLISLPSLNQRTCRTARRRSSHVM